MNQNTYTLAMKHSGCDEKGSIDDISNSIDRVCEKIDSLDDAVRLINIPDFPELSISNPPDYSVVLGRIAEALIDQNDKLDSLKDALNDKWS